MSGKTISISKEVDEGLIEGKLKGAIPGGNPSQQITYLMGLPQKVSELEKKVKDLGNENNLLTTNLTNADERIKELEKVKDDVIEGAVNPDKQRQRKLTKYIEDKKRKLEYDKLIETRRLKGEDHAVNLAIQAMKKDIVTKEDLQPLIEKIVPRITKSFDMLDESQKLIEASEDQDTDDPVIEGGE